MSVHARRLIAENIAAHNRGEDASRLDIGRSSLIEIPEEIVGCADWLKVLVVSDSYFDPKAHKLIYSKNWYRHGVNTTKNLNFHLGQLKNLEILILGEVWDNPWALTDLTPLKELKKLRELYLLGNQIVDLTPLKELNLLDTLYLGGNRITNLAPLKELNLLNTLYLNGNRIANLSPLKQLKKLTELFLDGGQIADLNPLRELQALTQLRISNNQISDLHPLRELQALAQLDLRNNEISDLAPLRELQALTELDLRNNEISDLSPLRELQVLTELDLRYNRISDLSPLKELQALTQLFLSNNQITDVSPLKELRALTQLSLRDNQITDISPLRKLQALTQLYLSDNQISDVGPLRELQALTQLSLRDNQIADIGPLKELRELKQLYLSNNPIKGTPITDWTDTMAILGYLKSLVDKQVPNKNIKVNIIGDGRIGKSQLYNYLNGQTYIARQEPTHGTETVNYKFAKDSSEYNALIWDFGGQAYHHGLHHVFIRPQDFNVVLWRNYGVDKRAYWLGTARNFSSEGVDNLILVQNVYHITDDDSKEDFRPDSVDYITDFLKKAYGLIPADDFHIDVKYLFRKDDPWKEEHDNFFDKWGKRMQSHIDRTLKEISEKWLAIKTDIDEDAQRYFDMPVDAFYVSRQQFENKLPEDFPKEQVAGLLTYLEFSGNILYLRQSDLLSQYIFIDPTRLAHWLYNDILDKKFVKNNNGILEKERLNKKTNNGDIFEAIMKEFNLLFESRDKKSLIIPQFLPDNHDAIERLKRKTHYSFGLSYHAFFHESRVFQFISEYGIYAHGDKSYWKYGLLFQKYDLDCLVYFDENERKLHVHIDNNARKPDLAREILSYFIHKEKSQDYILHQKLNGDLLIDAVWISTNRENYFDIKDCLERLNANSKEGLCKVTNRQVRLDSEILDLLNMNDTKLPQVFISYSRKDLEFKDELLTFLEPLRRYDLMSTWCCEEIVPGKWDDQIQEKLGKADVIVYMVSQNFMASEYIMEQEVKRGIALVEANPSKRIVCILARECMWQSWSDMEKKFKIRSGAIGKDINSSTDLSKYQFLPYHKYYNQEGKAVREEIIALESWGTNFYQQRNNAYKAIAKNIMQEVSRDL